MFLYVIILLCQIIYIPYIVIWGKAMANYPKELAQDAAYQSHTSRLTELWSLPRPAQGLNTYNNNIVIVLYTLY